MGFRLSVENLPSGAVLWEATYPGVVSGLLSPSQVWANYDTIPASGVLLYIAATTSFGEEVVEAHSNVGPVFDSGVYVFDFATATLREIQYPVGWVLADKVASTLKYETAVVVPGWVLVDKLASTLKYQAAVVVEGWVLVDKISSTLKAKGVIPPPPPDGEGEIPWGPIAIGVGAAAIIVAAVASQKKIPPQRVKGR